MSDDNIYQGPVILVSLTSFVASVGMLVARIFGAHDPEPFVLLPFSTVTFGVAVGLWIVGRERQLTPPNPKKESTSKYCKDCGRIFTMRQKQTGFDPSTGRPRVSFELGCPDADPNKPTPEYTAYGRYPMAGPFTGSVFLWPNCGDTKYVPLTPVGHNHADADTKTDCPKCIEDMLTTGIIDLPSAKKLMSSIR